MNESVTCDFDGTIINSVYFHVFLLYCVPAVFWLLCSCGVLAVSKRRCENRTNGYTYIRLKVGPGFTGICAQFCFFFASLINLWLYCCGYLSCASFIIALSSFLFEFLSKQ